MNKHGASALLTVAAALILCPPLAAADIEKATRIRLMKAVVYLEALKKVGNTLVPVARGSGTIISSSGDILTNNHVVYDEKNNRPHFAVAVGLTTSFVQKPRKVCLAFPKNARRSPKLDIAIIKCEAEMNGRPLVRSITWRTLKIGRSSAVVPGDNLYIVGYPNVGGMTITFTAGKVGGFQPEQGLGDQAWIKTDAQISPGVSGGAAFNEQGKLVGVPTQMRWVPRGRINIGIVRSIDLARPLLAPVIGSRTPAPRPPRVDPGGGSTRVSGTVLDASTRRPIRGASVLIIKPGIQVNKVRSKNLKTHVYTLGSSNSSGVFRARRALKRGATYGVVVTAKGYHVLRANKGIKLGTRASSELDVGVIRLRRKFRSGKTRSRRRSRGGCGCSATP